MSYKPTDLYDGLTPGFRPRKMALFLDTLLYDNPYRICFTRNERSGTFVPDQRSAEREFRGAQSAMWAILLTVIHNFPATPAFRDEPADSPIAEIALRVLVEFEGGETHVVGTATLIAGHLAITAKHVVDYVVRRFGARQNGPNIAEIREYAIRLYQVLSGPVYRVWNVYTAWYCGTDIAILHLGLFKTSDPNGMIDWKVPGLRCMPPPVGEKVIAFGYRESVAMTAPLQDGGYHLELQDKPTTSFGEVKRIYPERRDTVMLSFPCFEVNARFDPGMSGGLVVDAFGAVCGLVCSTIAASADREATSHIVTLWPMLRTLISAHRAGKYPKSVTYPVIDLALDGLITVIDLGSLNPNDFPGRILPRMAT